MSLDLVSARSASVGRVRRSVRPVERWPRFAAPLLALVLTSCSDQIAPIVPVATSIVLDGTILEFTSLGDTAVLTASVRDQTGSPITSAVVDWTSGTPSVATVSGSGVVTAIGNGAAEIRATSGGATASAAATVVQTPDSVEVTNGTVMFDALGDTARLSATVLDAGGSAIGGAGLTWSSSDSSVVTVSEIGVVTAIGNGTATITATAGAVAVTTSVTVAQVVTTVTLQPDSIVFDDLGQATPVTLVALDRLGASAQGSVAIWSTADSSIATVDSAGVVTSVGTGTVEISVDVGGVIASVQARVEPLLTLVMVSANNFSAEVGSSVALSARVQDLVGAGYEGATVTWAIDAGGGSITSAAETPSDGNGYAGATWRMGTAAGAQSATASVVTRGSTVTVTFSASAVAGPAASATLVADSVLLSGTGETVFLSPTYADVYGNAAAAGAVTWSSTDPATATVSTDGLVTGVAAGTTYVHATIGVSTDSILVTLVQRGAITVTFDDGFLTAYTNALPVMQSYNLVGNIGVYTDPIDGNWPAYMSLAQLQDLHDNGWSLVSHTVSHDTLTNLSDPILDYELRASQEWLVDNGFERGSHIFIAPYHEYEAREKIAASQFYTATRGVSASVVVPDTMVFWQPSNPFELTGMDADQLPYTTVAGRDRLRTMLQRTVDEGRFLDLLFHHVPPANVAAFDATMAIVNDFRERVLVYHELYPRFARAVF